MDIPSDVDKVERVIEARRWYREITGRDFKPIIRGWSGYDTETGKKREYTVRLNT